MTAMFLSVRALHVLAAALWLGSVVFISLLLMPAIGQLGPDGGKVMIALGRRGLNAFMGSIGGLTVLTGLGLYWHLTNGFDPALSGTHEAMVFGAGGLAGIVALILGGAVVGRSAKALTALAARLPTITEPKERATLAAQADQLRRRIITFGHVVMTLLILAIILMAIGHYV